MSRRIRRRKKQFPVLIIFFVASLFCFSIGYSLLQERLSITGKGSIVVEEKEEEYFTYTVVENSWGGNGTYVRQYQFKLLNIKDVQYISWSGIATVGKNDKISGCWNAICSIENGILTIKNEGYNATVNPNGTVEFGIIIEHVESDTNLSDIKFYGVADGQVENNVSSVDLLEEIEEETIDSSMEVTYKAGNAWVENGKYIQQFEISIKNNRETAITSWQIDLKRKSNYEIYAAYGTNFIEMSDLLRFSNVDYNGTIKPGETVSFQIVLASATNSFDIEIANVSGSGA